MKRFLDVAESGEARGTASAKNFSIILRPRRDITPMTSAGRERGRIKKKEGGGQQRRSETKKRKGLFL